MINIPKQEEQFQNHPLFKPCCGLNCVPLPLYVEVLTPNVIMFAFRK